MTVHRFSWPFARLACLFVIAVAPGAPDSISAAELPGDVQAVFDKPLYKNAVWGLRVVDGATGEVIYELHSDQKLLTGSVRKLISMGLALDKLGTDHRFSTPIYRTGNAKNGVLDGNLIFVASGDLAMGGRMNRDGSLAITNYDHNEANALGNAVLAAPDPLAGFASLAKQVAKSGIKEVRGDVVIDDRLFVPFDFRGEFDVRPIFVNDDVVDVMITPGAAGAAAKVDWRPKSTAFTIDSSLRMAPKNDGAEIQLEPENPTCFGDAACQGTVAGTLPVGWEPPLTKKYPLVRTFRITKPQNYARTALIEALQKAGVRVTAKPIGQNAIDKLPSRGAYRNSAKVAELVSPPYSDYAKWILKVSYNIGADTSLVLFGLDQGVDSMPKALAAERKTLEAEYNFKADSFHFIDGSGGGDSAATPNAIVSFLQQMRHKRFFPTYRDALPILATDGSLSFVTDFTNEQSLAGAKGNVYAKTGTYLSGDDRGKLSLRAQTLAGFIDAKSGRRLSFALFVNDVSPVSGLEDVLQVFQDEGTIAATIWREN